jgi:hypothetical protein
MAVEELPTLAAAGPVGGRLPEGNATDKGLDRLQACLTNLLELDAADYGHAKAKTKRTWLDDMLELLDPSMNPNAYRICQDTMLSRGAFSLLLGLGQEGPSDALRIAAMEVLIRAAFGHLASIAALAQQPRLLPTLQTALNRKDNWPEQLVALQLVQAVAAGSVPEVAAVAPGLVAEARPFLVSANSPKVLAEVALDCFVSLSFHAPTAVLGALGWERLADLLAEDDGRPEWLERSQLCSLGCGLLAANLLLGAGEEAEAPITTVARDLVATRLARSHFAEQLILALQASAERREWPQGSNTYHSPARLAVVVQRLAGLEGYRRRLADTVGPLACAIESSLEPQVTVLGLRALLAVARDVAGLRQLLALESFRSQTLEVLCTSGEEQEAAIAVELQSYLLTAENMLTSAQYTLDNSKAFCATAPDVTRLAEIFIKYAALDAEVPAETAFEMLAEVPLAPVAAIRASLSGTTRPRFGFQAWAQHIYGTPTICGWWPSYMEDTAAVWSSLDEGAAQLAPALGSLCALFEHAARGGSTLPDHEALYEVLPAAGLPQDGPVVEEAFSDIQGTPPMDFAAFALWIAQVCKALAAATAAAASEGSAVEG